MQETLRCSKQGEERKWFGSLAMMPSVQAQEVMKKAEEQTQSKANTHYAQCVLDDSP
jgi:hypothetical protein